MQPQDPPAQSAPTAPGPQGELPGTPQCPPSPPQPSGDQQRHPRQDLPAAPAVTLPPDPGARPVDSALRLVIILMFVNLGLSVLTTIITLILRNSVIDFQLAHVALPADATRADIDVVRTSLRTALWARLGTTILVSGLYLWRAYALRRGSRGAYLRLYYICIAGLLGIGYLILSGQYPVWMRMEQGLQAVVLAGLLVAVSRPEVRNRFAKQRHT
jgi:hypothetical protein